MKRRFCTNSHLCLSKLIPFRNFEKQEERAERSETRKSSKVITEPKNEQKTMIQLNSYQT